MTYTYFITKTVLSRASPRPRHLSVAGYSIDMHATSSAEL